MAQIRCYRITVITTDCQSVYGSSTLPSTAKFMSKPELPKEGTVEYYKMALELIMALSVDYDGYNPSNANDMKGLVDDMADVAALAYRDQSMFSSDDTSIADIRKHLDGARALVEQFKKKNAL